MAEMNINDIPTEDLIRIKERLAAQLQGMNEAELRIAAQAHSSLAAFVAQLVYEIARLLGYIISIPLAWAENIVKGIGMGLEDGFRAGYNAQQAKIIRRQ